MPGDDDADSMWQKVCLPFGPLLQGQSGGAGLQGTQFEISLFFLCSQSPFRGHSARWQTVKRAPSRCEWATRSARTFNRGEQRGTVAVRVFRINGPCLFSQHLACSWSFSRLYFRCASAASPDLREWGEEGGWRHQGKCIRCFFSSQFKLNKRYTKQLCGINLVPPFQNCPNFHIPCRHPFRRKGQVLLFSDCNKRLDNIQSNCTHLVHSTWLMQVFAAFFLSPTSSSLPLWPSGFSVPE